MAQTGKNLVTDFPHLPSCSTHSTQETLLTISAFSHATLPLFVQRFLKFSSLTKIPMTKNKTTKVRKLISLPGIFSPFITQFIHYFCMKLLSDFPSFYASIYSLSHIA